jgi:Co/Zn/Cd efflux system component
MGKILITLGACFLGLGIIIHLFGDKMGWLGNLYGDWKIVKSNYEFYFPLTSMIIISAILTLAINFFSRFFK